MVRANMNRFSVIAIVLASTMITAAAAPQVALVRVKSIYTGLPSTTALQVELKTARQGIMKSERANDLRRIIAELQALQARLSDKTNPLDETDTRKLARNYELKRQEAQTLQKEFEIFRTEQEKEINRKMVASMRASLNKILETAGRIAKEKGFDMVFDSSGNTNTGVAFVLYSKEPADLTAEVKAAMLDAEPTIGKSEDTTKTANAKAEAK